jgi:type I restriction enzyme S subunit
MTGSAGQKRVPENYFANLLLPNLDLNEQRRIADILDRADALRAKRRAALARLDELTQAIFVEMFGDAVSNSKNWKLEKLENFLVFKTGKLDSRSPSGNLSFSFGVSGLSWGVPPLSPSLRGP